MASALGIVATRCMLHTVLWYRVLCDCYTLLHGLGIWAYIWYLDLEYWIALVKMICRFGLVKVLDRCCSTHALLFTLCLWGVLDWEESLEMVDFIHGAHDDEYDDPWDSDDSYDDPWNSEDESIPPALPAPQFVP